MSTRWEATSVYLPVISASDWMVEVVGVRILMNVLSDSQPASWAPPVSTLSAHTNAPVARDMRRLTGCVRILGGLADSLTINEQ